jgi:hypothetical protein
MKTKTTREAKASPLSRRLAALLPGGVPRYVRCYDNGGPDVPGGSCDRYTVCFTGRAASEGSRETGRDYPYLAMSGSPFHPQGFGQHGSTKARAADCTGSSWAGPSIGRRCHLGTRVRFEDLPADCRKLVLSDYKEIWKLNPKETSA